MGVQRELAGDKNRDSTDIVCLVLMVFVALGLLIAGAFCLMRGSTAGMGIPFDSDGFGCGSEYPSFPFIYFPSPQIDSLWISTCVRQCPVVGSAVECQVNSVVKSCKQNYSVDNSQAFHIYDTEIFRNNICMPTSPTLRLKVQSAVHSGVVQQLIGSAINDWALFLLMVPVAMVAACLLTLLVRATAGFVIYLLYLMAFLAFLGFAIYLALPEEPSTNTFVLKQNRTVAMAISILSFLVAILVLLLFFSYKGRIREAVGYLTTSNQFLSQNLNILLVPVILSAILVLIVLFWTALMLGFYSMSQHTDSSPNASSQLQFSGSTSQDSNVNNQDSTINNQDITSARRLPFEHYSMPFYLVALTGVALWFLVWAVFMLVHSADLIVSGAILNWQLQRNRPVSKAAKAFLLSHTGSTCLGSYLTVTFGLLKFNINGQSHQGGERQGSESENGCCQFFRKCYSCVCCLCVSYIFKCFHSAAYSYLSISGRSYCQSSEQVAQLIAEAKKDWGVVSFLHMVFNDIIPLSFTVLQVLLADLLIRNVGHFQNSTSSRALVLVVTALVCYAVVQFFLSIYSQSVVGLFVLEQFHQNMKDKHKHPLLMQQRNKDRESKQQNRASISDKIRNESSKVGGQMKKQLQEAGRL